MEPKPLKDKQGAIAQAYRILPEDLRTSFLEALAELEDNACHRAHHFPHTQLHKVAGTKKNVYRAYIDKISGWRIHVQYGENNYIEINEVLTGKEHDDGLKIINRRKNKYS